MRYTLENFHHLSEVVECSNDNLGKDSPVHESEVDYHGGRARGRASIEFKKKKEKKRRKLFQIVLRTKLAYLLK